MKLTRKSIGRIAASFVATAMLATMAIVPASAAPFTDSGVVTASGNTVTVNQTLTKTDSNATTPSVTFTYDVAANTNPGTGNGKVPVYEGVDADKVTVDDVTYTVTDTDLNKTFDVDFSQVTWTGVGVYRYILTVVDNNDDVTTADSDLYLDVYVGVNDSDAYYVMYYVLSQDSTMTSNADGDSYVYTNKTDGFDSTYTTYSLTLTKTVSGTMANPNVPYTFEVDLSNLTEGTYVYIDDVKSTTAAAVDGTLTISNISLTPNGDDEIVITGIPSTAAYKIIEALNKDDGYTVTAIIDDKNADSTVEYDDTDAEYYVDTNEMPAANVNVTVNNARSASTPTGIMMDIAPYAVLVVIAAAGCFIFLRKRHAKED